MRKWWCNIDIKDWVTLVNEYWEYMNIDKVNTMCTDCIQQSTCRYIINCLREWLYDPEVLDAKAIIYEEKKKTEEFRKEKGE